MAHSMITPVPAAATTPIARSNKLISHVPSVRLHTVSASYRTPEYVSEDQLVHRRTVTLSLAGTILGLNAGGWREANAAVDGSSPPPSE